MSSHIVHFAHIVQARIILKVPPTLDISHRRHVFCKVMFKKCILWVNHNLTTHDTRWFGPITVFKVSQRQKKTDTIHLSNKFFFLSTFKLVSCCYCTANNLLSRDLRFTVRLLCCHLQPAWPPRTPSFHLASATHLTQYWQWLPQQPHLSPFCYCFSFLTRKKEVHSFKHHTRRKHDIQVWLIPPLWLDISIFKLLNKYNLWMYCVLVPPLNTCTIRFN